MPAATCPHCQKSVSVPAGVVQARCSSCGQVFAPMAATKTEPKPPPEPQPGAIPAAAGPPAAIIGAGIAVFLLLSVMAVGAIVLVNRSRTAASEAAAAEAAANEVAPSRQTQAKLTIADVPEPRRKEIYVMVRQSAKSSVERTLPAPKGSKLEATLSNLTENVHEYSQSQIAALSDVTQQQIDQIVAEGNAKGWPRR